MPGDGGEDRAAPSARSGAGARHVARRRPLDRPAPHRGSAARWRANHSSAARVREGESFPLPFQEERGCLRGRNLPAASPPPCIEVVREPARPALPRERSSVSAERVRRRRARAPGSSRNPRLGGGALAKPMRGDQPAIKAHSAIALECADEGSRPRHCGRFRPTIPSVTAAGRKHRAGPLCIRPPEMPVLARCFALCVH